MQALFKYTSSNSSYPSGQMTETDSVNNIKTFITDTIGKANLLTAELSFSGDVTTASTASMFEDCTNLTSVKITDTATSTYDFNCIGNLSSICKNCSNLLTFTFTGSKPYQAAYGASYAFYNCQKLTSVTLPGMTCSSGSGSAKDFSYMFYNCRALTTITCPNWYIYAAQNTTLNYMFYYCQNLTTVPTMQFVRSQHSTYNTYRVGMYYTYYNCEKLTTFPITLSGNSYTWTMYSCFYNCKGLTSINLSQFDHITNQGGFDSAFSQCVNLTSVTFPTTGFIGSAVKRLKWSFNGCKKLTVAGLVNWSSGVATSALTDFYGLFYGCNALRPHDMIPLINMGGVTTRSGFDGMFTQCDFSPEFDISDYTSVPWNLFGDNAGSNYGRFASCTDYTLKDTDNLLVAAGITSYKYYCSYALAESITIDLPGTNVTDLSYMFQYSSNLQSYDISSINTQNVTTMAGMLMGCRGLTGVFSFPSTVNTTSLVNISSMISSTNITSVNWNNKTFNNVENISSLFASCSYLATVPDLTVFNINKLTDVSYLFQGCQALTSITLPNFVKSNITKINNMFANAYNLQTVDVSGWDISSVSSLNYVFDSCNDLRQIIGLEDWDTSNATTMNYMFGFSSGTTPTSQHFKKLNISNFDTSNVTSMYNMFKNQSTLEIIYVNEDFDTTSLTSSTQDVFAGCTALKGDKGTTYDSTHVDATYAKIDRSGTPGYLSLYIKPVKINTNDIGEFYWDGSLVRSLYFNGTQIF